MQPLDAAIRSCFSMLNAKQTSLSKSLSIPDPYDVLNSIRE